ncbi:hypothetical protein SAMN04487949_1877 [Halogranum gelatinilyticum]|uniref:Uncharacterized protein n=1 Tax=Halogranum gelatinilyticum TaxID=660521 RepID=A0A1G9TR73_9EURY|nr:hypothetical protein [Halogranum gelatinilyticum]SDM50227.1 hypothetical protein SAMN04487949_1877 [Halogranum gelatinilyticum]
MPDIEGQHEFYLGASAYEGGHISLTDAFDLGIILEYFRYIDVSDQNPQIGTQEDSKVLGGLYQLENRLRDSTIETPVTGQIVEFRTKLEAKYDSPEDTISDEDRNELGQNAGTWQHLLRRELSHEQRIPVSSSGLLDPNRLLNSPEELFDTYVWSWLDERPQNDLREACKTIVVDCSTSSVMLSLRAVEHCLRQWYEHQNEDLEAGAWGQVLDQLMQEYAEEEKKNDTVLTQLSDLPPVLSNLYYLKEKRNEVSHPERSPSAQEARRTLMIVAATITDIHTELREDLIPAVSDLNLDFASEDDDLTDVLVKLIDELDDGSGAKYDAIYRWGEQVGIHREVIEETIHDLLMSGYVYEPDYGRVKSI